MKIQKRTARIIAIAILLIALVAVVVASVYAANDKEVKRDQYGTSLERSSQEKAEQEFIQENPEEAKKSTHSDTPEAPTVNEATNLNEVNVVLTNTSAADDQVNASGFVSNIVEVDGSCTYVFQQGEVVVRKVASTMTNPSSTTCQTARFNKSELGAGEWTVWIEYRSARSAGKSNTRVLTI